MAQVATVVITPSGSDLQVMAEVDGRPDGYNSGKTQFGWGDTVYLALYHDGSSMKVDAGATSGSISLVKANESVTIKDMAQFVNTTDGNTSKPIITLNSMEWFGSTPEPRVAKAKNAKLVLDYIGTGTPPPVGVYVGRVNYTAKANIYKLVLPTKAAAGNDPEYQVMVWFKAESA